VDATLGVTSGAGGYFFARQGVAAHGTLSVLVPLSRSGGVLVGGAVDVLGDFASGDDCPLGRDGSCIPPFPLWSGLSGEIGYRYGLGADWTLDGRLGAGTYLDEGGDSTRTFGTHGRVDAAWQFLPGVRVLLVGRATVLPEYRGATVTLASAGVGLRLGGGVPAR